MLQGFADTATKLGLPLFAVTEGASITRNNGSEAVRRAREAHRQYELSLGQDPDKSW